MLVGQVHERLARDHRARALAEAVPALAQDVAAGELRALLAPIAPVVEPLAPGLVVQRHADLQPLVVAGVGVEVLEALLDLAGREAQHRVVVAGRGPVHALEPLAHQGHHLLADRGDGVRVAQHVADVEAIAGDGHEALRAEGLEPVSALEAFPVEEQPAQQHAHAGARRAPLRVAGRGDRLNLGVQLATDDAAVEVERGHVEVGQQRQADAVEPAPGRRSARRVERHELVAVLGPALLTLAPPAVGVVRHLPRLVLALVVLEPPHEPARDLPELIGDGDGVEVGVEFGHGAHRSVG